MMVLTGGSQQGVKVVHSVSGLHWSGDRDVRDLGYLRVQTRVVRFVATITGYGRHSYQWLTNFTGVGNSEKSNQKLLLLKIPEYS